MKKIFSFIMLVVFCMALAGCGETAQEKKAREFNEQVTKTKKFDFSNWGAEAPKDSNTKPVK